MSILLNNNGYDNRSWLEALSRLMPERRIHIFPEIDDIEAIRKEIEFAVVWDHPRGDLIRYPNLRAILLLGAGTEAIDQETQLPDVPVVRLVDPEVLNDMALYALYWVMNFHRQYDRYREQQRDAHWQRHEICAPQDYRVTVLGLGMVGRTVASTLARNGYQLSGWDRFPQEIEDVHCFSGDTQLASAFADTDVLVNCLPLNAATQHFIDRHLLALMPQGSYLINVSRGAVINDQHLIEQLDNGHIAHAVLDAFASEPLPQANPFWHHSKVTVTPHMSGATYARSAARLVADNIQRIENGAQPFPLHQPAGISSAQAC
ncbi:2-hydroxyacid dehydrogenase [Marinobacterium jannaschii]|uniref:2-hydroxyacid dehydrogenase n=1 Tax=Marinobacterium jannaschii TaxID=64970 RepID=UPI0006886EAE|nr:glyoxylate/hydroxypyruvate reductase A [Marinobacterium jannaschii]